MKIKDKVTKERSKSIQDESVSRACIQDIIRYFGVTELLDAIDRPTVLRYVNDYRNDNLEQKPNRTTDPEEVND